VTLAASAPRRLAARHASRIDFKYNGGESRGRRFIYAQQPRFPRRVPSQFGTGNRPPRRSWPHHLDRTLASCHGSLRANPAGAGPGRGGLRAARPPGAVARRRPLVAGLRNTRGSRCLALMWRFTRAEGITIRDLIGAIRLRRDILAGLGYYTTSWGECSRCGPSSTA